MTRSNRPRKAAGDPYDAAVRYLASRPRSVGEIRRHLRGKGQDEEAIDRTIDQLRAQRYVDDEDFARYWIDQRERFRPKGDRAITSELMLKGVARDVIDRVLGERDPAAQAGLARAALRRVLPRWRDLAEADRRRKIHAFLVQRGFDYETIEEVLHGAVSEEEDGAD